MTVAVAVRIEALLDELVAESEDIDDAVERCWAGMATARRELADIRAGLRRDLMAARAARAGGWLGRIVRAAL